MNEQLLTPQDTFKLVLFTYPINSTYERRIEDLIHSRNAGATTTTTTTRQLQENMAQLRPVVFAGPRYKIEQSLSQCVSQLKLYLELILFIIHSFLCSGVGKGTLIELLRKTYPSEFGFSVSHTTRKPVSAYLILLLYIIFMQR